MNINKENIFLFIQRKQNSEVKKFLQETGINSKDPEQRTALHHAAFYNNMELLKWLIENNAEVNAQDNTGYTPIHFACQEGNIECVQFLLENNADVNAVDIHGNTPAWVTVMHWKGGKNFPVLKHLYCSNADLSIQNKAGNSANNIIPMEIYKQLNKKRDE